jgi:hypothetical protein
MSWSGWLGWLTGSAPERPLPEPRELVNLTGKTIHFCRPVQDDSLFYTVTNTLESSGPVPAVQRVPEEARDAIVAKSGIDIWDVPVYGYEAETEYRMTSNLRDEQPNVTLIVDLRVKLVERRRSDLVYVVAIDRQLVQDADQYDEQSIFCTGVVRTAEES